MTMYKFLKIFIANVPHSSVLQGNDIFLNRVINEKIRPE